MVVKNIKGQFMKHCCVIGGSGFIGSHLVDVLLSKGKKVTVIGRSPIPRNTLPPEVNYISGDYGDRSLLLQVLKDVDEVVDLAYSTIPGTISSNPINNFLSNLSPAVNFLETIKTLSLRKIIIISSGGTVYGKAIEIPIKEAHPTEPLSPYGIINLSIEKYAAMQNKLTSCPVVIIRPSNAYGERQKAFTGQGFIATALASIIKKKDVIIFGKNGTVRDYIYVKDLAKGISAVMEYGKLGECYNIGSGIGRSNIEIIREISPYAESFGLKVNIKNLPERKYDVPVNILDNSKVLSDCGWKPEMPFEVGIRKTWDWLISTKNQ